jgi:mannose-6-phosphate isomerase-like protein (cupin superfamily)|eukprot:jgi/Tetstr1/452784/TSEL_039820.t1
MPHILRATDRPEGASRTIKFEGGEYGADVSFFAVVAEPGKRVGLHIHPYSETWMVQEGTVRFVAGSQSVEAGSGDIMVVEPETPHGFENIGDGLLRMMCIHDGPHIIQTFLDPADD